MTKPHANFRDFGNRLEYLGGHQMKPPGPWFQLQVSLNPSHEESSSGSFSPFPRGEHRNQDKAYVLNSTVQGF